MSDSIFLSDFTENQEVEAKLAQGRDGQGALPESFWETYSAFANSHGGTVFLGVREDDGQFHAEGIAKPERVEETLWSLLNDRTKVSVGILHPSDVQRHPLQNGRFLIVVHVPRATRQQRPVYLGTSPYDGCYKRNRAGDYRCTREEVDRMLAERVEDSRDRLALRNYGLLDLHTETLSAYRQRLANFKPDHPYNDLDNTEFLLRIKGMVRDRENGEVSLTLAGLLMFGQGHIISEICPHYFLDYRELPESGSKTEWVDRLTADGTWSGNLFDFYRQVINRLYRDLKLPLAFNKDERSDDTPLHKALREALVNTLIHADYTERASIMIVKAPDYFGFRNPGHMRISIEDALHGGRSDSRNRGLQLMFSLVGLGEQAGSGIPRIVKRWEELSYRQPELWESDQPDSTLMRLRMVSLLPAEAVQALREVYPNTFEALGPEEQLAMVTTLIEGYITNQRLQQFSRLHRSDITDLLKRLVDQGLLVSLGAGRATTYTLRGFDKIDLADPIWGNEENLNVTTLGVKIATSDANVANSDANVATSDANVTTSGANVTTSGVNVTTSDANVTTSGMHSESGSIENDPVLNNIPVLDAHSAISESQWEALWEATRSLREQGGRMKPEKRREWILEICSNKFVNKRELGLLFKLDPTGLRNRFLTPMYKEGLLDYRFPGNPNHEQQAYRTKT